MKKLFKSLLIAAGFGVVLLVVGSMVLKFYFNEARLRSLLLPPLRGALGREVDISTISIDLFRGVKIGGLIIKEADALTDFVTVEELGLSYSLLPLLQKRLEIGRIWIDEPVIKIYRNRDGSFNFSDLQILKPDPSVVDRKPQTQDESKDSPPAAALPLALIVQRCDISGIKLSFFDKNGELPKVDCQADLTTKLDLGDLQPESVKVAGELKFLLTAEHKSLRSEARGVINFDRKKITYKIDLKQQDQACTLSGSVRDYLAAEPIIILDLTAARLDLAYLAGLGQQFASPPASPVENVADKPGKAVKPAPKPQTPPLLVASGKIDIKEARYENYRVNDLFLSYAYEKAVLTLSDLRGRLADGKLSGAAVIKPFMAQPEFKGSFSLSELDISSLTAMAAPRIEDNLYGTGSGEFKFSGHGADADTVKQTLSLDGKYLLHQVGMRKLPLTRALSQLLGLKQLEEVKMDEFAGNLRVSRGEVKLNSTWHGDYLSGSAIGDIGLDGGLDLPVNLILSKDLSAGLAQRYAWMKDTFNEKGEAVVDIYLKGTLSQPKLRLNRSKVSQRLQKKLEKKILQKLEKRLTDDDHKANGKTDSAKDLLRQLLQK
ncbi:MAG TPA: AsmA family protein [Desulfarculaceae bacterium]|nr:AsmA family protein [Desulfarculaceae bacterium]